MTDDLVLGTLLHITASMHTHRVNISELVKLVSYLVVLNIELSNCVITNIKPSQFLIL